MSDFYDKVGFEDSNMTIRAVIFDFGGVLYNQPDMKWMSRWQKLLGLENDTLYNSLTSSPQDSELVTDLMTGKLPEEEFWNKVANQWRMNPGLLNRVRKATTSHKRLNKEMADFLEELNLDFTTAILSNAGSDARRNFIEHFGLDKIVDRVIISAEEGVMKPDIQIYKIATDRLQVGPEQAIFLDDLPENVKSAKEYGFVSVQYHNNQQAIEDIKRIIRKENDIEIKYEHHSVK